MIHGSEKLMIHYYYGNGKGKTSSANGALIRAAGSGMKCALVQFFKNGTSSEIEIIKRTGADVYFCDFQNIFFLLGDSLNLKKIYP